MNRNWKSARFIAALGMLSASVTAQAQYTFTRIAESNSSDVSTPNSTPAINDAGQVVFTARSGFSQSSVLVGSGGSLTTIADNSGRFQNFGLTSIDGNGQAAFFAFTRDGHAGVFAGPGGATTLIDDSGPVKNFVGDPHSSAAGPFTVMHAFLKNGGQGIFVNGGGALTTIADTSGRFSNFDIDPRVNAFGQVAFEGDLKSGGSGVFTGNGGGITTITDTSGIFRDFTGIPSINDQGEVAFGAELKSGTEGIFVRRGGQIQTLVDTSGDFESGLAFGLPTLNDRGQVAFQAGLKTGGFGLFVGPDAVKDRVLLLGDALDGSTVTGLFVFGDYFNNFGQLAFEATLADGRTGIFRADPVPEPGCSTLLITIFLWGACVICQRIRKITMKKSVFRFDGGLRPCRHVMLSALACLAGTFCLSARTSAQIAPPVGNVLFLSTFGDGVQIYNSAIDPNNAGAFVWKFTAPQADLFTDASETTHVVSHFGGPTWRADVDGSEVVGSVVVSQPSPHPNSISELRLAASSHHGSGLFEDTTFIQRLDTVGGLAPSVLPNGLGEEFRSHYTATYRFFEAVPEPGSISLWLSVFAAGSLLGRRKRAIRPRA